MGGKRGEGIEKNGKKERVILSTPQRGGERGSVGMSEVGEQGKRRASYLSWRKGEKQGTKGDRREPNKRE